MLPVTGASAGMQERSGQPHAVHLREQSQAGSGSPSSLWATAFCSCLAREAALSLSASISTSWRLRALVWARNSSCSPQVRGRGDPCSDNRQPLAGPQPPDFPSPHSSLTRSRWVLRSSCRKSRRAPRTASGSRSPAGGELAGPGDGGSDPELCSKGLGLLGPSPLPGGGDRLRDAGCCLQALDTSPRTLLCPAPHVSPKHKQVPSTSSVPLYQTSGKPNFHVLT